MIVSDLESEVGLTRSPGRSENSELQVVGGDFRDCQEHGSFLFTFELEGFLRIRSSPKLHFTVIT